MYNPQNKIWLAQKVFSFDKTTVASTEDELLFAITCFALSGESLTEIFYKHPFQFDSTIFKQTGIELKKEEDKLFFSKKEINKNEKIEIDLSNTPQLAIPLALIISSNGLEADLTGLESLATTYEKNIIPQFQRELYRFNILTDFCGHSKLKIYNSKALELKPKPVNVSGSGLLSLYFLTLAFKFDEIKIILPGDFSEKYNQVYSGFVKLV